MSEKKQEALPNELSIELSEEVAEGVYSNLAIITHSNTEFVLDFVRVMPGIPKAKVKSRIILTPEHAARLLAALQDNLNRFEAQLKAAASNNPNGEQVSKDVPYPLDLHPKGEA
ncbi:DUF3467 domain-containing protein [Sphingobacterium thermophilum]|uniref:DUF3467 domain-containing protein n=1 Tax=Sphingobacterium thermophilum TaxID=768534 RepID=A0ABP8QWR3_9SPHI